MQKRHQVEPRITITHCLIMDVLNGVVLNPEWPIIFGTPAYNVSAELSYFRRSLKAESFVSNLIYYYE